MHKYLVKLSLAGVAAVALFAIVAYSPAPAAAKNVKTCAGGNTLACVEDKLDSLIAATSRYVFVSSTVFFGNEVRFPNDVCQSLADNATPPLHGSYRGWLASPIHDDPATAFFHATVPYRLVDDTVVARNWIDLTDGSLQNPIDLDENGDVQGPSKVWTNVLTTGILNGVTPSDNCSGWGDLGETGQVGSNDSVDPSWTEFGGGELCTSQFPIYCFEQ